MRDLVIGGPISDEIIKTLGWSGPFKVCSKCKIEKNASEFSPDKRRGANAVTCKCKECDAKDHAKAYAKKKLLKGERPLGKYNIRFNDPDYNTTVGRMKKYGITPEEYNALFDAQKGCCKVCDTHQTELKRKLCVDHCHDTGRVRGLLCDGCNLGLGKFKDDYDLVLKAAEYLKKY